MSFGGLEGENLMLMGVRTCDGEMVAAWSIVRSCMVKS